MVTGGASTCCIISGHCPRRCISCSNRNKQRKTLCRWLMTPGFHTNSEFVEFEFVEFEFIEKKCSVFIFRGGDIYPLTTFGCSGLISVTPNDGWRCNHFISLILLWRKGSKQLDAEKVCFDWLLAHSTIQLIRERCPHINTASQSYIFYAWVALCGFPLLFTLCGNLLLCQENEKRSFWSGSRTCWWTCVRGSVHKVYLLHVQVRALGSLDSLLTLQVRSSVPGSQDYSCHIYIYICTVGLHICLGVSSNLKEKVVAGQAWSILLSAIEKSVGTNWDFRWAKGS